MKYALVLNSVNNFHFFDHFSAALPCAQLRASQIIGRTQLIFVLLHFLSFQCNSRWPFQFVYCFVFVFFFFASFFATVKVCGATVRECRPSVGIIIYTELFFYFVFFFLFQFNYCARKAFYFHLFDIFKHNFSLGNCLLPIGRCRLRALARVCISHTQNSNREIVNVKYDK